MFALGVRKQRAESYRSSNTVSVPCFGRSTACRGGNSLDLNEPILHLLIVATDTTLHHLLWRA